MALPLKFDSRDPAVLEDPYPVYAGLREAGGPSRGGAGQWVVSRYADVLPLLRDRRLSHEYPPEYHEFSVGDGPATSFFQRILLDRDPPGHTVLRGAMAKAFTPRTVRALSGFITGQVDALLRPSLGSGHLEFVDQVAFPLPVAVVCELVGIPPVDRELVRPHAIDLAKGFALYVAPGERAATHRAVAWLREYIGDLLRDRMRSPRDDLLSRLGAAAAADGTGLGTEEIIDNVVFLFFAGFETTTNLLATMATALLGHPAELRRIAADPALVPTAVDEFLRWDAPIQATARLVREEIEVAGRTIRPGRVVVLLLGSANHDERQFEHPDRLDVGRRPNSHLSFGGGAHHCLGAAVAREEAAAVLRWITRNTGRFEPAGVVRRRHSVTFRSYSNVPVRLAPPGG